MANQRGIVEGKQPQGIDESISYTLDVSGHGDTPTSISVKVYDSTDGLDDLEDVTSTVMPINSPSVSGNVITLSPLKLLTRAHDYRVEVKYTIGGNILETAFTVEAER